MNIYIDSDKTQGIKITNQYSYNANYRIETLEFADGSLFNLSESGLTFSQNDSDENITTSNFNDIIYAKLEMMLLMPKMEMISFMEEMVMIL